MSTVQEIAYQVLSTSKTPLKSRDIAAKAISGGLFHSNSKDPVGSFAQTLEKNIRDATYNKPELVFVQDKNKRLVSLPNQKTQDNDEVSYSVVTRLPPDLVKKLKVYAYLNFKTESEVVAEIMKNGFDAINKSLSAELKKMVNNPKGN